MGPRKTGAPVAFSTCCQKNKVTLPYVDKDAKAFPEQLQTMFEGDEPAGGVFTPPEVLWRCVHTSRGALEVCSHLQRCSGGVFTPPEVLWRCVHTSRGALEVCSHLQRCSGGVFTPPEVLWRCVHTSRGALEVCLHLTMKKQLSLDIK
ncbi:hypothetical protein PCASD_24605 [Puccinia coronata f. sp. avenae]|uniref:Uncharacterized protein n=1 Tax=Puccinia coronata f. sp. avenae TaxID=200324 RepID=A0A2N5TNM7_9BASI|nr:hypothetical protein PCASD_24605 [Puccinia coronata f. sp. avenae]